VDELDWNRLIDQLSKGNCTPFLGAGACATLPTGPAMSKMWADRYGYPFPDDTDLPRVMQFAAIKSGDTVYIKEKVCEEIAEALEPDFSDPFEPHALLAEFPVPVLLTTNYDDFLARALRRNGKEPVVASCQWYTSGDHDSLRTEIPALPDPTEQNPLIYHLHGTAATPKSLVLIENDYLEFLVQMASSRDGGTPAIVPNIIHSTLADNPLLFVGYSMQDWTFRVLFHGLLRSVPGIHRRRNVSVQLLPEVMQSRQEAEASAREFLTNYFGDWRVQIYWGTAADFCEELRSRMNRR
jgi:hypothetical protein